MRAIANLLASVGFMVGLTAAVTARADGQVPQPFVATYAVSYRGLNAGNITFSLTRDADGRYVYETHADPTALASLFVSRAAVERSVMDIGPQGVRPLEWQIDDGKSSSKGDGSLHFDWDLRCKSRSRPNCCAVSSPARSRSSTPIGSSATRTRARETRRWIPRSASSTP
jgi:hypothetical protein